eukprot:TRINITY_DN58135_c0_g1_i1.p1 TRINITY_DN58135_c0_g1~~TRINITY_DN58135_c0_g1_i1.p1  ORF type:complete len:326 (-),score=48.55 TRINITY_DN58135_c0_g1_i1:8-964(-)
MSHGKRARSPAAHPDEPAAKQPRSEAWTAMIESLSAVYSLTFPDELFAVWQVACEADDPLAAFEGVGIKLVGPFEILSARCFAEDAKPHLHWRFPYDPPEFMTVMVDSRNDRHWGYVWDDPKEPPVAVASGTKDTYTFTIEAPTLIASLTALAEKRGAACAALAAKLRTAGSVYSAPRGAKTLRRKKTLGNVFSGLGMVVPYDSKTQLGYRDLPMSVAELKRLLQRVASGDATKEQRKEYDQMVTFVDVANDECDFGHGLEVGLDMFCIAPPGSELLRTCQRILDNAYMLLGRPLFQDIITDHLPTRHSRPLAQPMET